MIFHLIFLITFLKLISGISEYEFYVDNDNKYLIRKSEVNYKDAVSLCGNHDMTLISIYDETKQKLLERLMKIYDLRYIWTAGYLSKNDNFVIWIDTNTKLSNYSNWMIDQPYLFDADSSVIIHRSYDYKWRTNSLNDINSVVCSKKIVKSFENYIFLLNSTISV